jgi:predicted RND superfamily exporter protein
MQLEIRTAIARDRLLYNAIGFIIGCGLAFLFFRRASFLIVAAGPPLFAILFALGLVGWLGFRLNVFLNVMTPLVMVISFSDSMQLTFAARDQLIRGRDRLTAFREAIRTVGPACVLTHATAGLSFLALLVSESELIRAFGEAGFLSVAIALVTVLTLVPALGLALAPTPESLSTFKDRDGGVDGLRRFCDWMAGRMTNRPGAHSLAALVVVGALGLGYIGLQPRYSLADQVPDRERALQAINRLDAKLSGANPIDVLVEFPEGDDIFTPRALETIADVHRLVETQAGVGNVWSPESLRRWLAQTLGKTDIATLKEYVDLLPQYLVRRFVSEKRTAAIVSGRVPDKESSDLLPVVDHLDGALNAVRDRHPGFTISVTGLAVIAARNSANMIGKLNRGLTIEFLFVAAFIGVAFRSASVALATILTGIFPVVAAAALLRALGDGLQFASVVALTVSFGLGLSATIHFLNRLWPELGSDEDPARGVKRATVMMGPPLLLTAGVLTCGLAATSFSALPALRLFGWLSAFAMLAAVVADLTILRPVITYLLRRQHDARARRALEATSPPTVGV